ncbi:MAG: GerW family sporulation protein [Oscillospiraceae bacterium]|nr:GerW family sporulation protein [Oscillospiraceae bacterium]MDY6208232.1 GerW family sporulation protein [Oscillospiraceae bacterium]
MDTKVKELITASMDKIHEMADANTIMGKPVKLDGGVTIIPVSKVSYGFAGGGSDLPSKTDKELFGGASGAGITVTPLGFLVVSNGEVQLMQMNLDVSTSSAIVNMVPEVFNKVAGLFKKDKTEDKINDKKSADIADPRDTDDIELPEEMIESGMTDGVDFDFKD